MSVDVLDRFHPVVARWFTDTLGTPSAPQRQGWPAIASGASALILAPTGTGKTLAAFLWELDTLLRAGIDAPLANAVHALYVSPLKALNNDIQRNLEQPLRELRSRFLAAGIEPPAIRVAVRTGDTPPSARARMLRTTPHILITTPESLHILLTTVRGRGMFSGLRTVIIDEIHAIAGTKRGAHLALTLERLEHAAGGPPQRIGLSATQRPLEEIARFLGGMEASSGAPVPRPVRVIDCGLVKRTEVRIESPVDDLAEPGGSMWLAIVPRVLAHIRAARTTLIFVNNRALAERVAGRVNALAEEDLAQPYHGSLARERRMLLEEGLKGGAIRALVCTSALELGIDIGSVDLVIQLQSPKRVAAGLQRVGRAGHSLGAVSRGVFMPTHLDDALEMTAIVDAMRDGDVEPTAVVQNALDVLAQIVVAAVSVDEWLADDLFALVRRAYPYHALTRAAFDEVLAMLSGKYPPDVAAELAPRLTWDRMTGRLTGSRASRMAAVVSGGTIPDRGLYTVNLPDRARLGELDEEFVHESRVGDVFQLGSTTWRIGAIEHDRVIVTPAPGAPARMPFWKGEWTARPWHLAPRVAALRRTMAAIDPDDEPAVRLAADRHAADDAIVRSLARYVRAERDITGVVPTDTDLLLEQSRDETGAIRLVLHAPFGGRVTAPWAMAIAHALRERLAGVDLQVQTSDEGILFRLPDLATEVPLDPIVGMTASEAEQRILDEVGTTSLFGARFRMNAARALLLPRGNPRRRMPLWLQRLKALDLLQAVREFPSFPILVETYRDVLRDAFDMEHLQHTLDALERGDVRVHPVTLERASPFAASLQLGFVADWLYVDDTPRAERSAALLSLDRAMLDDLLGSAGTDDATDAALRELLEQRQGTAPNRRARTVDELTVLLERAGDLTVEELRARTGPSESWRDGDPVEGLLASGRAIGAWLPARDGVALRILLAERYPHYLAAFGAGAMARIAVGPSLAESTAADVIPEDRRIASLTRDAARRELLARWIAMTGPNSVDDVRVRYDLPAAWVQRRFDDWHRGGRVVRGYFGGDRETLRWCPRRLLEHARRRALAAARRAVAAVPVETFVAFLQRWQHVDPRDRLAGVEGVAIALRQLAGLARPAGGWERDYLRARVAMFDLGAISRLTQSGELVWVGTGDSERAERRIAAVRFVPRGAARRWLPEAPADDARPPAPRSDAAVRVRSALGSQGASFLADLAVSTGLGPSVLRAALHELAAEGAVTNDTAEALRALVRFRPPTRRGRKDAADPARWLPADFTPARAPQARRVGANRLPRWRRPDRPGSAGAEGWGGRWSLVHTPAILGAEEPEMARAEAIARAWLDRYGIVTREWWVRERPPVAWRTLYLELKRLELRGDVRRGYFVKGLSGAQFALPGAVEALRAAARDESPPAIVMAATDPANAWGVIAASDAPPVARPRGPGGLLVTRGGRVIVSAEGRGRRLAVADDATAEEVGEAIRALVDYLRAPRGAERVRDIIVDRIGGTDAAASDYAGVLSDAGFRRDGMRMRYDAGPA